jgi:hypothetical protein
MRVFLGIILGFFLTIGLAYVADTGQHAVCPAADGRPLVNWDEANLRLKEISTATQAAWHKLSGH